MRVGICVSTYNRAKLLAGLLQGLEALTFQHMAEPDVVVAVADNDVRGSAREVCAGMTRWTVKYSIEPQRGLAEARNCALQTAGQADFFAFIDDDEVPEPHWLEQLLLTQAKYSADVVSGPVAPLFSSGVPAWVSGGRFFDSPSWQTGHAIDSASTNNVLVAAHVFEKVRQFDKRFKLAGGEDFHFFRRVHTAGFTLVWSADAIVGEVIGSDRANFPWLLRRAFRSGNCAVMVECALDQRLSTRVFRFVSACGSILVGGVLTLPALLLGRAKLTVSLRRLLRGFGMITGLTGLKYQTYRTVTGE